MHSVVEIMSVKLDCVHVQETLSALTTHMKMENQFVLQSVLLTKSVADMFVQAVGLAKCVTKVNVLNAQKTFIVQTQMHITVML